MENPQSRAACALQNCKGGQTCSEAVMTAFVDVGGVDEATARSLISGMAGGMGGMGKTCGAVTAAFITFGLALGPQKMEDAEARQKVFGLVDSFAKRFTEEFGSIECKELCVGFDLHSQEDMKRLRESGLPAKFVEGSAALLEKMLMEQGVVP